MALETTTPHFRTTICGLEELEGHCGPGVSHVLSILDPAWPVPEAFGAHGGHARLELRFDDVIEELPGRAPPREEHIARLLAFGRDLAARPGAAGHLLVHCHAGVSRSTASTALILAQARPGLPAAAILAEVLRIRAQAWPNLRVVEMGDAMLGRGGALVAAAHRVYRHQLEVRPHLAGLMEKGGRGREVAAARAADPAPLAAG